MKIFLAVILFYETGSHQGALAVLRLSIFPLYPPDGGIASQPYHTWLLNV